MTRVHEHLVEDRRDHVAVLRVDREEKLGALDRSMMRALGAYLDALALDPSVRALVLTGTGRGFVAGADIAGYDTVPVTEFASFQELSRRTFDALEALPQPTVAAVNGYALGGGFELTLCCDAVVAAEEARFGLPEVRLGLLPGGGGTQRLARLAGERVAKELVLTGRTMRPDEAERCGVVNAVVPGPELLGRATSLAETFAAGAPIAVREGKRLVHDGLQAPLPTALTLEQRTLVALFATDDATEGIRAFLEKRDPEFTGT